MFLSPPAARLALGLLFAALPLGAALSGCTERSAVRAQNDTPAVPYALDAPDATVELPAELEEISGLTRLPSGRLGAVQDEDGILYEIDASSGLITGRQTFRKGGDYEGVEWVGDSVWILESDGTLYDVHRGPDGVSAETVTHETRLRGRNDTEGLAWDGERLLIACKESPGRGLDDVRAIWAYDPVTDSLSAAPVALLDRTRVDGQASFKPSALAVHPQTRELYVLSSVRKALAVLGPDGALRAVVPLPPALYRQPEGIVFAEDGTLYISNEAAGARATLLRFAPRG